MFSRTSWMFRSTALRANATSKILDLSSQQRHIRSATNNRQSAEATISEADRMAQSDNSFSYFDVVMPSVQSKEQIEHKAPLMRKIATLPLVQQLANSSSVVREEFYWPLGKVRLVQAPETLAYGALSGDNDLPLAPLVFRWKEGGMPNHINAKIYNASFQSTSDRKQWANVRVPGVTSVQYLGSKLNFSNQGSCSKEAHPGVASALLDEVTARVSISNTLNKPTFTANFQLDYVRPVPVDRFVELNAWLTRAEGRKVFIYSYVADALSGEVLVTAKSLFVSAP
ncbi:hypothetical protein EV175_002756 [Coemansia sp. RSA 1933]|nr:hypothetical protein EV175_002756 [Coemansia sp. RSA 1933]